MTTRTEERCACGQPLHYTTPHKRLLVEKLIEMVGDDYVEVIVGRETYRVQRHYLALHGVKARELSRLATEGIVERVGGTNGS